MNTSNLILPHGYADVNNSQPSEDYNKPLIVEATKRYKKVTVRHLDRDADGKEIVVERSWENVHPSCLSVGTNWVFITGQADGVWNFSQRSVIWFHVQSPDKDDA